MGTHTKKTRALSQLYESGEDDPYYKPIKKYVLNPKAITMSELYGAFNEGFFFLKLWEGLNIRRGGGTGKHKIIFSVDQLLQQMLNPNFLFFALTTNFGYFFDFIYMSSSLMMVAVASYGPFEKTSQKKKKKQQLLKKKKLSPS